MERIGIYFKEEEQKEKFINELNQNEILKNIYIYRDYFIKDMITDIGDSYTHLFAYIRTHNRKNFEKIAIEYFKQYIKDFLDHMFLKPAYKNLVEDLTNIFMIEFSLYYENFYLRYITTPHDIKAGETK